MHHRENALKNWIMLTLSLKKAELTPLTGDASFRRYFRLVLPNVTYIVVDAPPKQETFASFIAIANLFDAHQIRVPKIHAVHLEQGFAILEDFGHTHLLDALTPSSVDKYYQTAIDILLNIQRCPIPKHCKTFNETLMLQELSLFTEWFLKKHYARVLSPFEEALIKDTFTWLTHAIDITTPVLIHRDYHARNLMILEDTKPLLGVIDFQDAAKGPLAYDVISLLKDCYIKWPPETRIKWLRYFYDNTPHCRNVSFDYFSQQAELCGLQRHLKVLGIFSRLSLRDGKTRYLADLPLVFNYVMSTLKSMPHLTAFHQFLETLAS